MIKILLIASTMILPIHTVKASNLPSQATLKKQFFKDVIQPLCDIVRNNANVNLSYLQALQEKQQNKLYELRRDNPKITSLTSDQIKTLKKQHEGVENKLNAEIQERQAHIQSNKAILFPRVKTAELEKQIKEKKDAIEKEKALLKPIYQFEALSRQLDHTNSKINEFTLQQHNPLEYILHNSGVSIMRSVANPDSAKEVKKYEGWVIGGQKYIQNLDLNNMQKEELDQYLDGRKGPSNLYNTYLEYLLSEKLAELTLAFQGSIAGEPSIQIATMKRMLADLKQETTHINSMSSIPTPNPAQSITQPIATPITTTQSTASGWLPTIWQLGKAAAAHMWLKATDGFKRSLRRVAPDYTLANRIMINARKNIKDQYQKTRHNWRYKMPEVREETLKKFDTAQEAEQFFGGYQ